MSSDFDPYYKWLGIPPNEQPPNHYRLLVITLFEKNSAVIEAAANRQMNYLQQLSSGEDLEHAQQLLGEVSRARVCLLNAEKKAAYDKQLRSQLAAQQSPKAGAGHSRKQPTSGGPAKIPSFAERGSDRPTRGARTPAGRSHKSTTGKTLKPAKRTQPQATRTHRKKNALPLQIILGVVTVILIVAAFLFLSKQEQDRQPSNNITQRRQQAKDYNRQLDARKQKERSERVIKPKRPRRALEEKEHLQETPPPTADSTQNLGAEKPDNTEVPIADTREAAEPESPPIDSEQLTAARQTLSDKNLREEAPKPEAPKPEAPKPEAPNPEAPNPEAQNPEAQNPEAQNPEAPKLDNTEVPNSDTREAAEPESPPIDSEQLAAARQTLSEKGLRENEQEDWEPAKAAEACLTLQVELEKQRELYYTTFDKAIEAQKAKWNKEFNELITSQKDNGKMLALGKLLPRSIEVDVNGLKSKPPRSPAEILATAKKEVFKDKMFRAELQKKQTKFQADLEALQKQQAILKKRYRQSKNSKPIREALEQLGKKLTAELAESEVDPLAADPSRRPSPTALATKKALQQLRARWDKSDPEAGLPEAKYAELEAHFDPLGEEKAGNHPWRYNEESILKDQLDEIRPEVTNYKKAVTQRDETLQQIGFLKSKLEEAETWSEEKKKEFKAKIEVATAKLKSLKEEKDKSAPETKEIVELLIDANQQARRIDAWNQKYKGFTDPDGTTIQIKTNLKRLKKELGRQRQVFVKAANELRKAEQ